MGGDLGARYLRPARHQFPRGKTLLGVGVGKHVAEQDGERLCGNRAGLAHGETLCDHIPMSLSGAAARRKKVSSSNREEVASRPALLLAWYDRHRRKLPWRPLPGVSA